MTWKRDELSIEVVFYFSDNVHGIVQAGNSLTVFTTGVQRKKSYLNKNIIYLESIL